MSEWGCPIPVDGTRPEWLKDNDQVHYSVPDEPGSITGQAYLMGFGKAGEYRLQAEHWYYKEPNVPIEQLEREEEAHAIQAFLRKHEILRLGRHNENFNIYRTPGADGYERFGCGKTVAEALENAQ